MNRFLSYHFFIIALIVTFASCKKSVPDQVKYIPKDALLVFDLNWKSLSDKTAKGNINWDSLFNAVAGPDEDSSMAKARKKIDEFMQSGIDNESNVFMYIKTGGSIMSGQRTSGGVVAAMKDAAQFEAYVKKQDGAGEITKEKDYSYIVLDEDLVVGWNKEVAILAGADNSVGGDSSASVSGSGMAKQTLATLFSLKEEESVASIPEFVEMMAEKGDILMWNNSSGALNAVPLLGMTKFADLLKGSYSASVINFEDGKLTANVKSYSGKELAEIWKKYAGPTADMSMVTRYPLPIQGFAAFSFNPQIIKEIIQYSGFESTANEFLQNQGYIIDDILKVFKGDFAIIFSDITMADKVYEYEGEKFTSKQPSAKLIFNAAISDKAAYDKIAAKLAEQGMMEQINGQYVPTGMGEFAFSMDGKNLIVASDSVLLQQYLTGKGNAAIPAAIAEKAKNKSVVFYADINKILQSVPSEASSRAAMESAKATFKEMTASSENFNGKYVAASFELATVNAKENSLVSLVKFFASVANDISEQQKKYSNRGMVDLDEYNPDAEIAAPPAAPVK